jgi:glycine cleavage system regulatory protein
MNTRIILSIIGPDKPGIVSDISKIVKNHLGNIEKSRMIRLGDFFTIMVLITINREDITNLNNELINYSDYKISIHELADTFKDINKDIYTIHLNGMDTDGLVYNITHELSKLDINIEELRTNIGNAPMSGLALFSLTARVTHPKLDYTLLKEKMGALASKLDVNIIVEN